MNLQANPKVEINILSLTFRSLLALTLVMASCVVLHWWGWLQEVGISENIKAKLEPFMGMTER